MARLTFWSDRASTDLAEIAEFISRDSDYYARSVVRAILQKTRKLPKFPFIGRPVPELEDESIREIFAYSYRIIYRVTTERIEIVAVIHGSRRMELHLQP